MKQDPFTLLRHRWYAMQIVFPSGEQHFSPNWLMEVRPLSTGRNMLQLAFWHANYPEGVQHKVYDLKVLRRRGYLLAERKDTKDNDLLIVTEITLDWVQTHFPTMTPEGDIQHWLDRHCGHP